MRQSICGAIQILFCNGCVVVTKSLPFVANWVAEILDRSTVDQWRHIAGADNPADLGVRGLSLNELMQSVWINGPDWLKSEINETENWEKEEVVPDRQKVFEYNSNEKSAPIDWKRLSNFKEKYICENIDSEKWEQRTYSCFA